MKTTIVSSFLLALLISISSCNQSFEENIQANGCDYTYDLSNVNVYPIEGSYRAFGDVYVEGMNDDNADEIARCVIRDVWAQSINKPSRVQINFRATPGTASDQKLIYQYTYAYKGDWTFSHNGENFEHHKLVQKKF